MLNHAKRLRSLIPLFLSLISPLAIADADARTLEPVTVSATKQGRTLEEINRSATVVSAETLRRNQVERTSELDRVLPGVHINDSGSLLFPVIALRGVTSAQDFYNPALTVYVDGVPQLPTFTSQQLLDVERVELLRGPQGTLYGKSAQGGVVNIVTRAPGALPAAELEAGLASRDGRHLKAGASGALVPGLLFASVTGAVNETPGDLRNPVTGDDDLGGQRAKAARARLRLAPTGQPWELNLTSSGEHTRAQQDAYVPFADTDADDVYLMPGTPAEAADFDLERWSNSHALNGHYHLDGWRLSATAAWQTLHYQRRYPIGPYVSDQPEHWRQNMQEIRLERTGEHRLDALFGLYRQDVRQQRDYRNDLFTPMAITASDVASRNRKRSLAAFTDVTWHPTPAFNVSAGARLSRDRAATRFQGSNLDPSTLTPVTYQGQDSSEQNTVLGKISSGYRITPAWRLYANLAQGYKPRGYNLAPSSPADAEPFERERSLSQEVGVRYHRDQTRFSAAFYRIETRDLQLYVSDDIGYQTIRNVGRARSTGIETEAGWALNRRLDASVEAYYNHARLRRLGADADCEDCSGNQVPFSPEWGVTGRLQGRLFTAHGPLLPSLTVRHMGSHYFDLANDLRQDGYTLTDVALAWAPTDSLTVSLYAHNLTDRRYRTYAFANTQLGDFAQIDPGRTLGLTLNLDH